MNSSGRSSSSLLRRTHREGSVSSASVGSGMQTMMKSCKCHCGLNVTLYVSNTSTNPKRPFFGCKNFMEKKPYCKFFKWLDEFVAENPEWCTEMGQTNAFRNEVVSSEMGEGLHEIKKKMEEEFGRIHNDISCMKIGFGGLVFICILFIIVVLCVK